MLTATNIVKAKKINRWVIFQVIRSHGPLSRTQIAEVTGLSRQAASSSVEELIAEGYLREDSAVVGRVGKPAKPVSLDPARLFTIGVHVDYGRVVAVASNLLGETLAEERARLEETSPAAAAETIHNIYTLLTQRAQKPENRLRGIGLATPGPFGVAGVSPPRLPGWDGLDLLRHLRDRTTAPVILFSDGKCALIAESFFGTIGRELQNFLYVNISDGLGTAIMAKGEIYGGAYGNAGEFGHMLMVPGGHLCICGKRGCLETYASVSSLLAYMSDRNGGTEPQIEDLTLTTPGVTDWLEDATGPLRQGLNALENLFDPETILIGGDAPDWLRSAIISRLMPLSHSISDRERLYPRLMPSELGADAIPRGAAILPFVAALNPGFVETTAQSSTHRSGSGLPTNHK